MTSILTAFENQTMPQSYLEADEQELCARIARAKQALGTDLLMLAHHYQKDEVVAFADETGDSLQLAQIAAKNKTAKYIVFCGVHFMAETADMLTEDHQQVLLPDLSAGCSMADMANQHQLTTAWIRLQQQWPEEIIPITYVNSSAAVKAFVGDHGGAIVTSGNADTILRWAFTQKKRVFFLPDQHLGRNTAYHMAISLNEMALWDPLTGQLLDNAGKEPLAADQAPATKVILWNGWCSVHQQFSVQQIDSLRHRIPDLKVIVHPEAPHEVVEAADEYGSTNKILQVVKASPAGTKWAVGTDHNLVGRMAKQLCPDHEIHFINPIACACLTMNRIKLPHLAWCLEELAAGRSVNRITVDEATTASALKALERMLALS